MVNLKERYGPFALITGASSGIGRTYAYKLASLGFNLILAARKINILNTLGEELMTKHPIYVKTVQADLSDQNDVNELIKSTENIKVGLLINNAGNGYVGSFIQNNLQSEKAIIQLNIITPLELTHHFGNKMVKNGKGAIIWIGSTMGFQGTPYAANYSATKAFAETFCQSIRYELKGENIDVQVVAAGPTNTSAKQRNDIDFTKLPLIWMDSEAVVEDSLKNLGIKTLVIPGRMNKIISMIGSNLILKKGFITLIGNFVRESLPKKQQ